MPDLDIGRLVGYVELDDAGVAEGAKSVKDRLGELGKGGAGLAKAAGLGMGLALGAGLMAAIDVEGANAKLTAQLDLSTAESERLGGVAGRLYANAYGENIGEVNEAIRAVVQNIGDLGDADLERVTGKVQSLATAFDQDLGGVTRAVGTMLKTGLAKDADEALDVLASGFQNGVNVADDLLDTFSEYSTQARKLGLDGASFTAILSQGLKGGARDADTVADALKELSIRAIDGSEATSRGFETLGLDGRKMGEDFAAGGDRARAALDTTLDKLRAIPDPVARSAAAVDLLGTKSEDLGAALFAIDPSEAIGGLDGLEGAASRVDEAMGGTLASSLTKLTRSLYTFASDALGPVIPVLTDVGGVVLDVVAPPLELISGLVGSVASAFADLPGPVQTALVVLGGLALARGPIGDAFDGIKSAAVSAFETVQLRAMLARDAVGEAGGGLSGAMSAAGSAASGAARGGIGALSSLLGGPLGIGIAAVSLGLPLLSSLFDDNSGDAARAARANSDLAKALDESNGAITASVRAAAAKEAADKDMLEQAEAIGLDLADVTDAILGNEEAYDRLTAAANAYIDASLESEHAGDPEWTKNAEGARQFLSSLDELAPTVSENAEEQRRLAAATGESNTLTGDAAVVAGEAADAATDQADAYDRLKDAIDRYLGINIDAAEAQINVSDGLADLTAATDRQAASFDMNSQSGRDSTGAVLDQIGAIGDLATAVFRQTGSSEQARAAWDRERQALRDRLVELGYSEEAIDGLLTQYAQIPGQVWTDVQANTGPAETDLNNLAAQRRTAWIDASIRLATTPGHTAADVQFAFRALGGAIGGIVTEYADGGLHSGITPMAGGVAQIVAPGDLRVIGDRVVDDEFYIPDNDDARSLALGAEWLRRRGLAAIPLGRFMADGAIASSSSTSSSAAALAGLALAIHIDGNVYGDDHLRRAIADAGDELLERLDAALSDAGVHHP